jgi:glutamate synthase (NADPH/NADH) large chain
VRYLNRPDRPRAGGRADRRETLATYQKLFNITFEERDEIMRVLAETSRKRSARWATTRRWRCCRTRCARCTTISASSSRRSPTRRSIRCAKTIVMSLQTQIGRRQCVRSRSRSTRSQVVLNSPVLSQRKLTSSLALDDEGVTTRFIDLQYAESRGRCKARSASAPKAEAAVRDGKLVLLLSDRYLADDDRRRACAARHGRRAPPPGRARACAASAT